MSKISRIERVASGIRGLEELQSTAKGYCLGYPKYAAMKRDARNAVHATTLEEAGSLVGKGISLRLVPDTIPSSFCPQRQADLTDQSRNAVRNFQIHYIYSGDGRCILRIATTGLVRTSR